MKKPDYHGWKNRETWNVALFLNNDESLYLAAHEYMLKQTNFRKAFYRLFIQEMGLASGKTPDGIQWISNELDYHALNELMKDFGGE